MIRFYQAEGDSLAEIGTPKQHCWVLVEQPTPQEIDYLVDGLGCSRSLTIDALDPEERSHIDREGDQTLVMMDMPVDLPVETKGGIQFSTLPVGFLFTKDYLFSMTSEPSPILEEIADGSAKVKNLDPAKELNFLLLTTFHIASHFIMHLGSIDKIVSQTEKEMRRNMKNEELIQLLGLEKSLVYFTTSLKSTEVTLNKIARGKVFAINEQDQDLLEDCLIEIQQSIETAEVYTGILSSTMDAVASIISNNMNEVMKALTSLTIVLSIPNMIFGFYGMNVQLPAGHTNYLLPVLLTVIISALSAFLLYINGFFEP